MQTLSGSTEDPEYIEWAKARERYKLKHKTRPKYASVKYKIEERFGDKEARREHNLVQPNITELPGDENKHLVPYGSPTGRTRGQLWSALRKNWLRLRIAKNKTGDVNEMYAAAKAVRATQKELGIALTEFTEPFYLTGQELSEEELQEQQEDGLR